MNNKTNIANVFCDTLEKLKIQEQLTYNHQKETVKNHFHDYSPFTCFRKHCMLCVFCIIKNNNKKNHKEKATWHAMSGYGCG